MGLAKQTTPHVFFWSRSTLVEGLIITELELISPAALAVLTNRAMYTILWWNKPFDNHCPFGFITLTLHYPLKNDSNLLTLLWRVLLVRFFVFFFMCVRLIFWNIKRNLEADPTNTQIPRCDHRWFFEFFFENADVNHPTSALLWKHFGWPLPFLHE